MAPLRLDVQYVEDCIKHGRLRRHSKRHNILKMCCNISQKQFQVPKWIHFMEFHCIKKRKIKHIKGKCLSFTIKYDLIRLWLQIIGDVPQQFAIKWFVVVFVYTLF